jgi:hypothetical protein
MDAKIIRHAYENWVLDHREVERTFFLIAALARWGLAGNNFSI